MSMIKYSDMLNKAYAESISILQREWQAEFKLEQLDDRLYQITISKKNANLEAQEIILEIFESGISIGDSYKRGILFAQLEQLQIFLEAVMLFLLSQMLDVEQN